MTKYVVFKMQHVGDQETWQEGVTVEARSAKAAIQSATLNEHISGVFVAVPARSWKPVTVTVETKTTLKFQ